MERISALLLLAFAPLATAGARAPEALDPNIAIVSTQVDTRVIVYQLCSPEHCWSETYLQALSLEPNEQKVLCTTKIKEIFIGHVVNEVSWSFVGGAPQVNIRVSASHGGFKPHTVTLIPLDSCQYALRGARVGS